MAWRFVSFQRIRFADKLKHQTLWSGGNGENGEVLQFVQTLGQIVAND